MPINALHPMLEVRDLQRSIAFYRDLLGFEVAGVWPEEAPGWCRLVSRSASLMLTEFPEGNMSLTGTLYFYPDDTAALWEAVREHATVAAPLGVMAWGMREFRLRDPDGYTLSFGEPTDAPADHDHGPEGHTHPH